MGLRAESVYLKAASVFCLMLLPFSAGFACQELPEQEPHLFTKAPHEDLDELISDFQLNRAQHQPVGAMPDVLGQAYWVDAERGSSNSACSRSRPCSSLAEAAGKLRPGDALVARAGIYRESIHLAQGGTVHSPITVMAYPGEHVIISGADPLADDWARVDSVWRYPWSTSLKMHRSRQRPQQAFRPEMLIVDDRPMVTYFERAALQEGGFWVEGEPESPLAFYARFPDENAPSQFKIEASRRALLFAANEGVDNVHVQGFVFLHGANSGKNGCLKITGENWVVEDNLVAWCNGIGIQVDGNQHTVRRNWSVRNGQMGWYVETTGSVLEGNHSTWNNWKGYDARWEAGGGKISYTSNTSIIGHYAAYNEGPGIWLDIENDSNLVERCTVVGNLKAGIMLEYRTTNTVVRNNVVFGTRILGNAGSGLQLQAASHNTVEYNTIYSNYGDGIRHKHNDTRAPSEGNVFRYNIIVANTIGSTRAQQIRIEGEGGQLHQDILTSNLYSRVGPDDDIFKAGPYVGDNVGAFSERTGAVSETIQASAEDVLEDITHPDGWRPLRRNIALTYGVRDE